jgi:hypothetical protein
MGRAPRCGRRAGLTAPEETVREAIDSARDALPAGGDWGRHPRVWQLSVNV